MKCQDLFVRSLKSTEETSDYSDKIKITEIKKDFFKLSVGGTGVSPVIL